MREQRRKDRTERKRRETANQDARYTKRMTSSARKEQPHTVRTSSKVDLCSVHRTVLPSPVHRRIIRELYVPHTSPESHQGLSESGFFSRIWDISRYIRIYPLKSSRHPM